MGERVFMTVGYFQPFNKKMLLIAFILNKRKAQQAMIKDFSLF